MLATWKWPRRINPHYDEVKQASAAWLAGFGAFSPKAQQAFDRCDFSMWLAVELFPGARLLPCRATPDADEFASQVFSLPSRTLDWPRVRLNPIMSSAVAIRTLYHGGTITNSKVVTPRTEHLRTGCDLMNLFFVIDEYTDVATEPQAREMARVIMDAIHNPSQPRPDGEWIGGEIARQ